MICKLGLECIDKPCPNKDYCDLITCAWPLPYRISKDSSFTPDGTLIVEFIDYWEFFDKCFSSESKFPYSDEYDYLMARMLHECHREGWHEADELPYRYDEELQAMKVVYVKLLDEDTCFHPPVLISWKPNYSQSKKDNNGFYFIRELIYTDADLPGFHF